MWELDCKERWALKNWRFCAVVLEKTLESPLDCKEIQTVQPKGNWPWLFIARTHADVETPRHWPPDAKNWLIEKEPDAGKDWRQEEKGMAEDEMIGWHHHDIMSKDMNLSKLWGLVTDREACRAAVPVVAKSWTRLSNRTELKGILLQFPSPTHCPRSNGGQATWAQVNPHPAPAFVQAQGEYGTWRPTGLEVLKVLRDDQTSSVVPRLRQCGFVCMCI